MNKRTIVIFLSLYACVLNVPQAYGMLSHTPMAIARQAVEARAAAAGAGAGSAAAVNQTMGSSTQKPQPEKLLPKHICDLAVQANWMDRSTTSQDNVQKAMSEYLDNGGDIDAAMTGNSGGTLLHTAAAYCNQVLVRFLLERGANIEALDNSQMTPLLYSVFFLHRWINYESSINPVVKELIDAGADINATGLLHEDYIYIDHTAGCVSRHLNHPQNSTPHIATYIADHKVKTREAIKQAFNSITGMQGPLIVQALADFTCGPIAQKNQQFGLLKRVIIDSMHQTTRQPAIKLISSIRHKNPSLFTAQDECGYTLLSFASYIQAIDAHTAIEQAYKKHQAQIAENNVRQQKEFADQQAAQKEMLKQAVLAGQTQAITTINDIQVINARYDHNKTALILAAEKGHDKVVDALLAKKANLACLDDTFNSALWYATQYGHKAIVERILKEIPLQGASPVLRREITQAHELAAAKEKEVVINKELYKQIKELLVPYLAQEQAAAK